MSSKKKIVKNTSLMLASEFISTAISLGMIILVARYLGNKEFGKFSFVFAFVNVVMIFAGFGETFMVVRELARKKIKTREYFGNALTLKVILLLIVLICSIAIISVIDSSFEMRLLVYLASLATCFLFLSHLYWALLRAYEIMYYEAIMKIVERLLLLSMIVIIYVNNLGLLYIVSAFALTYFASFLMAFIFVTSRIGYLPFKINANLIKDIIKKGFPFAATVVVMTFYFRVDVLMLSKLRSFSDVGMYNAAYRIVDGISFIPIMVVTATFPAMSKFYITNRKSLKMTYQQSFNYIMILAVPMAVGITILADRIIGFAYGSDFLGSAAVLKIIVWAEAFIFLNYIMGNLLNVINKQKLFTYVVVSSVIINILLNILFIPKWGHIGAGLSILLSQFLSFLVLSYVTSKFDYSLNLTKLCIRPAIAGLFMAVVISSFDSLNLFFVILFGTAIYFGMLFLIGGISKEDFSLIKYVFQKA